MGTDGVSIQAARETDLDAIARLAKERALPDELDESREDVSSTGFLVAGYTLDDYRDLLVRADHFYVARKDDEIVGFVLGYGSDRIEPDEWLNSQVKLYLSEFVVIKQVCVDARHASQGVASLLYRRVLDRCPSVPVVAAVVSDPPNEPSTQLHRRHGFEPFLHLTPPDGLPRTVWIRRRREMDGLLASYDTAAQLYLHEDDLNWRKLHNFLYVTVALFAAFGFVLSMTQNGAGDAALFVLLAAIPVIGLTSVLAFGIALHSGIHYMDARKDAFSAVEALLIRTGGGAPVITRSPSWVRQTWLRRSPTRITLRAIPVVVGLCWLVAAVTAFTLH